MTTHNSKLQVGLGRLLSVVPGEIQSIDTQPEHPLIALDLGTGKEDELTRLPAGPWMLVNFMDGSKFAIWKATGDVYRVGPDGAVEDDPMIRIEGSSPLEERVPNTMTVLMQCLSELTHSIAQQLGTSIEADPEALRHDARNFLVAILGEGELILQSDITALEKRIAYLESAMNSMNVNGK